MQDQRATHSRSIDRAGVTLSVAVRPAAVLVPVIDRGDMATVLFTRRSDALSSHAGQIAFPGGKVDPCDVSPVEAALREAEEEIGLDRRMVEPVGLLQPFLTGTGYRIVPVMAVVTLSQPLAPDPGEVSEIFEVPLDFLMTAGNHQRHKAIWQGREREYYAIPYGERFIWGATAGILRDIYERLYR